MSQFSIFLPSVSYAHSLVARRTCGRIECGNISIVRKRECGERRGENSAGESRELSRAFFKFVSKAVKSKIDTHMMKRDV